MRRRQTTERSRIPGIEAKRLRVRGDRLVQQADVQVDLPELAVGIGETRFERDRALEILNGAFVRKAIGQAPGQLRSRQIGLSEVRVHGQRLFDGEKGLLFRAAVGVEVEEALRVGAAERRLGQRELRIGLYGLFEECQSTVDETR